MRWKKERKRILMGLLMGLLIASLTACGNKEENTTDTDKPENTEITITMGRQTLQNPKLPDGDTYENNAYTRLVKDVLNIKIIDEFEANGADYDRQVSLALSAGEIPDIMKVVTLDELQELYENDLIADLTEVYEKYASDYLKQLYDSYDGRTLEKVTFDGKMMALPGTNGDSGPSEVWIRSDWTKKLGITLDEDGNRTITLDELEMVAKKFLEENPGNAENPVGMAFAPWLTSGDPDGTYSINSIAYALGAFPKTWMKVDDTIVYGSTTEEMKTALAKISAWYQKGIIDPQLGTRTWDDITALLSNGQTGITFGTWHIPDWLLNNIRVMDADATFESYGIENADGKVPCKHNDAAAGYIVVSKKCKNPEAVILIANLFYDTLANSKTLEEDYPEVAEYLKNGVDGSVRPFNIEISSYTSLLDDYSDIEKGVNGEIEVKDARTSESRSIITGVKDYLANPKSDDIVAWSKYHSRMKGVELIQTLTENDDFLWITPIFPQTTETMETNQANLDKLEEETFIKIATGMLSVEEGFDNFVAEWKKLGGEQILSEILDQQKGN